MKDLKDHINNELLKESYQSNIVGQKLMDALYGSSIILRVNSKGEIVLADIDRPTHELLVLGPEVNTKVLSDLGFKHNKSRIQY